MLFKGLQSQNSARWFRYSYIRFKTNHDELYDLVRDPEERTSIVNSSPEEVEMAKGILEEHKKTAKKLEDYYRMVDVEKVKLD